MCPAAHAHGTDNRRPSFPGQRTRELLDVQALLGHRSQATMSRYLQLDERERDELVRGASSQIAGALTDHDYLPRRVLAEGAAHQIAMEGPAAKTTASDDLQQLGHGIEPLASLARVSSPFLRYHNLLMKNSSI